MKKAGLATLMALSLIAAAKLAKAETAGWNKTVLNDTVYLDGTGANSGWQIKFEKLNDVRWVTWHGPNGQHRECRYAASGMECTGNWQP
jgi:hypothetical protein